MYLSVCVFMITPKVMNGFDFFMRLKEEMIIFWVLSRSHSGYIKSRLFGQHLTGEDLHSTSAF